MTEGGSSVFAQIVAFHGSFQDAFDLLCALDDRAQLLVLDVRCAGAI